MSSSDEVPFLHSPAGNSQDEFVRAAEAVLAALDHHDQAGAAQASNEGVMSFDDALFLPASPRAEAPADEDEDDTTATTTDGPDVETPATNVSTITNTTGTNASPAAGPSASSSAAPGLTSSLNDPVVPAAFRRKLPSLVNETDPWACPICFHAFVRVTGIKDHILGKHPSLGLTAKTINDFPPYKEPHTLSWYRAQGADTTYRGTDRKQINARRRMEAGLRTTDPEFLKDVYKDTPAVRAKANLAKKKADEGN